jgi:SAM-dependent methyltransferase
MTFGDDTFSGATCFSMLHHVPGPLLQDRLFAEVARVVRPGGLFVASDSLPSEDLKDFHEGDTYEPLDPDGVAARLECSGFADVEVRTNEFGWAATGRAT